jgi:carbonic anhydrase/acetyltransferase-like protein (isoleucine patch superfamily)
MKPEALLAIIRDPGQPWFENAAASQIASELAPRSSPNILPYDGVAPQFDGEPILCGPNVSVLGRVQIGAGSALGRGAVVRADGHFVKVGTDFALGEGSTIHISHELYPTVVGYGVSVGRNCVVHACRVGDGSVVEDDVVILDGSVVASGVLIEAGSNVFPRSELSAGLVYAGSPAKPVRRTTPMELQERARCIRALSVASALARSRNGSSQQLSSPECGFVALTASVSGHVELGRGASIFFGCALSAEDGSILIGDNSNVQDNTIMVCRSGNIVIGSGTTIGHNVRMNNCVVGSRSLVGMGSLLSTGTTVEDDVFLAAGSTTDAHQILETGWLWAGRPARPMSRLNEGRRAAITATVRHYSAYALSYEYAQKTLTKH